MVDIINNILVSPRLDPAWSYQQGVVNIDNYQHCPLTPTLLYIMVEDRLLSQPPFYLANFRIKLKSAVKVTGWN